MFDFEAEKRGLYCNSQEQRGLLCNVKLLKSIEQQMKDSLPTNLLSKGHAYALIMLIFCPTPQHLMWKDSQAINGNLSLNSPFLGM